MVKVTKEKAEKNRADIVAAAGRTVRKDGLSEASVAAIAKAAGLTHGAVYRHFASKDAMAAAAIGADFATIASVIGQIAEAGGGPRDYAAVYLGHDHRDHFPWGCPAAPLAAEVFRASAEVQAAFADGVAANLTAIEALIPEEADAGLRAAAILATLAGAMALARATRDAAPELSETFLAAGRAAIARLEPPEK